MTVIYISGPRTGQNRQKINGIAAYAKRNGWNFQTVEIIGSHKELNALSDLWHPDGYIANCSVEVERAAVVAHGCAVVIEDMEGLISSVKDYGD